MEKEVTRKETAPPVITTELRKNIVLVPDIIKREASGLNVLGRLITAILFTTDIAIIRNTNADAVIAVYPFTPHPAITQAIMSVADVPVLCGVGGGLTYGQRCAQIAFHAECQGALAVVLNAPTPEVTIRAVREAVDIPVIITVVSEYTDVAGKIAAGADIVNVSGGPGTARVVREIRKRFPGIPIIATGGQTDETILRTIEAGANAITYTPPSNGQLFKEKMEHYREEETKKRETGADGLTPDGARTSASL
jgi:hypothetical protein